MHSGKKIMKEGRGYTLSCSGENKSVLRHGLYLLSFFFCQSITFLATQRIWVRGRMKLLHTPLVLFLPTWSVYYFTLTSDVAGNNMIQILNNGYFIHRRYLWRMPQSISLLTTINISVKLVLLSWQETDIWDDVRSGFDIVINIPNVIFETGTYVLFKYGNTVRMEQDRTNPVIHCLNVKSKVAKLFPFQITFNKSITQKKRVPK